MCSTVLRDKKTYTDKTKLSSAARDDTLRSKDTKRSVCARKLNSVYIVFTSDPAPCLTVPERVHNSWRVTRLLLLYGGSQTYKCIISTISNRSVRLNVSSRAAGFNLVLSVYVFLSLKAVEPIDCHYMTDRLQKIFIFSAEETKSV